MFLEYFPKPLSIWLSRYTHTHNEQISYDEQPSYDDLSSYDNLSSYEYDGHPSYDECSTNDGWYPCYDGQTSYEGVPSLAINPDNSISKYIK